MRRDMYIFAAGALAGLLAQHWFSRETSSVGNIFEAAIWVAMIAAAAYILGPWFHRVL